MIIIYIGEIYIRLWVTFFFIWMVHVSVVSYSILEAEMNCSFKINQLELLQGINIGVIRINVVFITQHILIKKH